MLFIKDNAIWHLPRDGKKASIPHAAIAPLPELQATPQAVRIDRRNADLLYVLDLPNVKAQKRVRWFDFTTNAIRTAVCNRSSTLSISGMFIAGSVRLSDAACYKHDGCLHPRYVWPYLHARPQSTCYRKCRLVLPFFPAFFRTHIRTLNLENFRYCFRKGRYYVVLLKYNICVWQLLARIYKYSS